MKDYMNDLNTRIEAQDRTRIYVDSYDEGVWMNIIHQAGNQNAILSKEQAKDLIAALIRIVDAEPEDDDCVDEKDEDYVCPACKGSGEGMSDGSSCYKCKGTGGYPKSYNNDDYE